MSVPGYYYKLADLHNNFFVTMSSNNSLTSFRFQMTFIYIFVLADSKILDLLTSLSERSFLNIIR